jgi:hypothetical protein
MNKFVISTPGRTASTSLFNYIEDSLKKIDTNAITIDRGLYSFNEWHDLNIAQTAVFTTFNPFNFPTILETINPLDWCLIVLSRQDFANWLLSINVTHATNKFHPGKEYKETSLVFKQDEFMSSYWYYKCWERMIYNQADTFNFNKIIYIDFDELTTGWQSVGQKINGWEWDYHPALMKLGMNATWKNISNLDEVLSWIPDQTVIDNIKKSL